MTLVVAINRSRIHVSAFGNQELHHLGVPARRGPHQRRLSSPFFSRIDFCAVIQQQLCRFHVPCSRNRQQCGLSISIR